MTSRALVVSPATSVANTNIASQHLHVPHSVNRRTHHVSCAARTVRPTEGVPTTTDIKRTQALPSFHSSRGSRALQCTPYPVYQASVADLMLVWRERNCHYQVANFFCDFWGGKTRIVMHLRTKEKSA
ncbi:hypothetical protein FHG87_006372 [Trinorchestia longiramus]|nr:hypothetical protein FHG87_006372 [Trinorchestia longiramus]